mmetsp:Transcript_7406/g.11876  ORF Transcript_7406/g.11876 Transcript_7406/m.11876 type:complete len:256 (+) Transcript_7406:5023-5790(+)
MSEPQEGKVEESKARDANWAYTDENGEPLLVGKKRRFYTPTEVALHNCAKDCWVSIFGKVYDLTALVSNVSKEAPDYQLTIPIVSHAGKDISHWFDEETREVKRALDETTGLILAVLPFGRFIHVAPSEPVSNWSTDFNEPWWKDDERYCIGSLSQSVRNIVLVNMLTYQDTTLHVCEEETLNEIQDRYMDWNAHSGSYTWKVLDEDVFRPLDMNKTLTENGIIDETDLFENLSIPVDTYTPTIHVYFNDDLTEA